MIKISLADDQSLLCQSLAKIIDSCEEFSVVSLASNGKEVLKHCERYQPDIVLLDIEMPIMTGLEALRIIKRKFPDIKVIMLTTFDSEENIFNAFLDRADAYITKDISPEELFVTIHAVNFGMSVIANGLTEILVGRCKQRTHESSGIQETFDLDEEDILIIRGIVKGKSNKKIADEIGYSEGTIKNRLSKIYEKLAINDRVALAVYALDNGIVE